MNQNLTTCPLCQQENKCAVSAKEGCWCMKTPIPKALIAQLPTELKNKTCICNACVEKFNKAHHAK
ncbi:cysteine-rich CWC family protein [Thalassotalea sp. PLHSN55]|uniref:cysteine-rich CWC family protein n=1 Tax=Thalassotalea sp. PLHSN55 TaxID=3435888 RepID=UPI003F8463BB